MKSCDDHERAIDVTRRTVQAWDPFELLANGAPPDEFEAEVAKLVTFVPHLKSPSEAAAAISAVFLVAFEGEPFTPDNCAAVGNYWFQGLCQAGLVHHT